MIDHETHSGASPITWSVRAQSKGTVQSGAPWTHRIRRLLVTSSDTSVIVRPISILIWLHLVVPASVVGGLYPFGEVWVVAVWSAAAHVTTTVVATATGGAAAGVVVRRTAVGRCPTRRGRACLSLGVLTLLPGRLVVTDCLTLRIEIFDPASNLGSLCFYLFTPALNRRRLAFIASFISGRK